MEITDQQISAGQSPVGSPASYSGDHDAILDSLLKFYVVYLYYPSAE
jgi:hypothetical protein